MRSAGLAVDDRVDGAAVGGHHEGHVVAQAVQDVRSDVAVGRRPFPVQLDVQVLIGGFPDGVVLQIAGDFALLDCKCRLGQAGRGIECYRVLPHGGYYNKCKNYHDCANHKCRHRYHNVSAKTLERVPWKYLR